MESEVSYKATIYSGARFGQRGAAAVIKKLSRDNSAHIEARPDKPRQLYYIDFSIIQPPQQC